MTGTPHSARTERGVDPRALASRPSTLRQAAVWKLVQAALDEASEPGRTPTILDCGGGSGSLSVPLALTGADVTVLDISVDALATLSRRAAEAGVSGRVRALQADLETLDPAELGAPPASGYDMVLAHGVLQSLGASAVPRAISLLAGLIRPGGVLSILLTNPASTVLARVLAGEIAVAAAELRVLAAAADDTSASGSAALEPRVGVDEVRSYCIAAGLLVDDVHGVGVFTELIPGAEIDGLPYSLDLVDELERLGSQLAPFRDIAGRLHLLARRPSLTGAGQSS